MPASGGIIRNERLPSRKAGQRFLNADCVRWICADHRRLKISGNQRLSAFKKFGCGGDSLLDPLSPREGRHDAHWRVVVQEMNLTLTKAIFDAKCRFKGIHLRSWDDFLTEPKIKKYDAAWQCRLADQVQDFSPLKTVVREMRGDGFVLVNHA
jgi:hypothetical protein